MQLFRDFFSTFFIFKKQDSIAEAPKVYPI